MVWFSVAVSTSSVFPQRNTNTNTNENADVNTNTNKRYDQMMLRHFLVQQCIPTLQCVAFCLVMLPNPHAWCQLGNLTKQCPTFGSLPLITHCTARPGLVLLTHLRLSHRHCLLLIITATIVIFTRRSSENISLLFLPSLRFWWAKDQLSNLATFKSNNRK